MREFIQLIQLAFSNPSYAFAIIAGSLSAGLLWALIRVLKSVWKQSLDKMAEIQLGFAKHSSDVRTDLKNHTERWEHGRELLQKEVISLRGALLVTKEELIQRIQNLSDVLNNVDLLCVKVARELKMTAEEFSTRFGRLFELRDEVVETRAKVIQLGKEMEKQQEHMSKVATILDAHKDEIEKLRGKK